MTGCYIVGLGNAIHRTVLCALAATDTLVLINHEGEKALTYACGTLLVHNVSDILVAEEVEGSKNGVGCGLTKTTERVSLDVITKLLKSVYIFKSALAVGNFVKNLK